MKKIFLFLLSLSFVALLGVGRVYAEELVINGGFESPEVTGWSAFPTETEGLGWTVEYTNSLYTPGLLEIQRSVAGAPHEGLQHVELDSHHNTRIYQDLNTTPDYLYRLVYWYSARPNVATNQMSVSWDGAEISAHSEVGGLLTDWKWGNQDLTASTNTTRIQFEEVGPDDTLGMYLDAVSVVPVDEDNDGINDGIDENIGPDVWLESPEDNYYTTSTSVLQTWDTDDPDIDYYKYESCSNDPDADGSCTTIYSTTKTTKSRTVNNNNIVFWWRVRGIDIYGNTGNWSEARKITIDTIAPTIVLNPPVVGATYWESIDLRATCDETCDYINFWWRADGKDFSNTSPDRRYHYEYDDGEVFSWTLDTLNAERWGGDTSYEMDEGLHYFYAAGKDLAGNWARSEYIPVYVKRRAADIVRPEAGEMIFRELSLEAYLVDNDIDPIQWAVRKGTCAAGTNTFLGNVDGHSDSLDMNYTPEEFKYSYTGTFDISEFDGGMYCFIFNPKEDAGESNLRITREFYIAEGSVHGGGQIIKEIDSKPKDNYKISFGGQIWDLGNKDYAGDWEVNFHNVGDDKFDQTKFHTTEIIAVNHYSGDNNSCNDALNFTAIGRFGKEEDYILIFRAGDYLSPGQFEDDAYDTVRVTLYNSEGTSVYDTHDAGEFPDQSHCVGTARTGLDHGNITISY